MTPHRNTSSSQAFSRDMLEFRPEWQFDDPQTGVYYHSAVIPGKLFFTSLGGDISLNEAEKGIVYLERVFKDGMFSDSDYVRIADYSGVIKASINTRLLYANTLNRLNSFYNCKPVITYICGASQVMRAMLRIFSHVVNQKFVFVESVDAAFGILNSKNSEQVADDDAEVTISRREMEDFAATCGHLLFGEKNIDYADYDRRYPVQHPLNELYRIIVLLHSDIHELRQRERMQSEEIRTALDDSRKLNEQLAEEKRNVEQKEKTQQKLIEKLKNARLEAESANKAKSEFLTNISHELRTPLHAVIGMTELLIDTRLDKDQREYTDTLYSSAHMLLMLINDILDFNRIEEGHLDEEKAPFNLRQLFLDIIAIMKERASCKGLLLLGDIDEGIPERLIGYSGYIKQVLLNLIQNAIKFTYRGHIMVNARIVSESEEEVLIEVSVQDTGVGVPEKLQGQVFEPFTQIDASTTRKEGGTGLGLAIVKKLVAFMEGEIQIQSSEKDGSTFSFILSYEKLKDTENNAASEDEEAALERSRPVPAEPFLEQKEVLLVEDNTINQKVAQAMLEKMGYKVNIAFNGFEAVNALQHKNYSLVLMDLQMPVMDGYEATRTIRSSGRVLNCEVPIIAMTANATKEDQQQCLDAGMDDFVPKPVERKLMMDILKRWLPFDEKK
jgi:signal transduction histidine kinase/ActR/RegA family two-component response regulator